MAQFWCLHIPMWQWWRSEVSLGIWLDVSRDIQLIPKVFGLCREMAPNSADQLHPDSGQLDKYASCHDMEKGTVSVWGGHPQLIAIWPLVSFPGFPNHSIGIWRCNLMTLVSIKPSRGIGCILWVQTVIDSLPQSLQWCMQYHVILDRVKTALACSCWVVKMCISETNVFTVFIYQQLTCEFSTSKKR